MKWKKVAGWTLAIIVAVIVIVVVGGDSYLKSNAFRELAMRKIVEQTDQATGGRSQIEAFDFDLSTLTAHLYGIVLRGSEPQNDSPLLHVDKLTVGLKVQSLVHHRVTLSELLIEHPVAYVQVNRKGASNIPQPPPNPSSRHINLFDLAVGHAAVINGEVSYKDRKTPIDADLHNLEADVSFEPLVRRYQGSISYDSGRLHYGQYMPVPHSMTARFSATPSKFSLESAILKVASSTIALRGEVNQYEDPQASGEYNIQLHTQDFAEMSQSVKTAGDVLLTGKLQYRNKAYQPLLRTIAIDGKVESTELLVASSPGNRVEVRRLRGNYQLANAALRGDGIEAELLGGSVRTDLDVRDIDKTPKAKINASLHNISLRALQRKLPDSQLERVAILGRVNGTASASWTGDVSNLLAKADLTIRSGSNVVAHSVRDLPVNGAIHAVYDSPRNELALRQTTLRIPSASLTAEGKVGKDSRLQIQATAADLHQLAILVSAFGAGSAAPPAISGSATLNATVRGAVNQPQLSGEIGAQNLSVEGSEWKSASLTVEADPSQLTVSNATLVHAQHGRASFSVTIGLRDWGYLPSDPVHGRLSLSQVSVADLQRLAKVQYPVSGELSASVSVGGSQLDPKGSGLLNITNGRAYDEPLHKLALNFNAGNGTIASTLNVATNAGSATTHLSFTPKTKGYALSVEAPGIVLQKLHVVQEMDMQVNGTLSISARGQGTLNDPQLTVTARLPRLDVRQKSITGVKAEVQVANKAGDFKLETEIAQASVRARGHINLTGDYESDASVDTTAIPLDVLLATYAKVPDGFRGQTELHANLKGPLKDKTRLEARVTIPTLQASYQSLQIGAATPIRVDYSHSVVTLQPAEIRGTDTSIRIQGSIPLAGTAAPTLTVKGSIDAQIMQIAMPEVQSSGMVALDVHTSGLGGNPQVQGQIQLQNINVTTAASPLGVQKLNGALDISNDRVQISKMTAEVGGGQLSAGGSVTYRPRPQFNIALQGKAVRLRYPNGLRTVLDSNLAWTGDMQASTLNGRVLIGALSFTPDFDLASFGDQFGSNAATPAEPGFSDTVHLQIAVQSKGSLSAATSQVSIEGDANLHVSGTAANPIVTGRTDLNAGELFYRNVRYHLERGIVTFDDPNETKPVLNVAVSTKVEQYDLTINLRGPFDALTVAYSSEPPLSSADVINLIARGKTSSELAASSQSTDSMVASQAASQVSGGLQKLVGISSLQIDPLLGGNNQNPSARVAIQQRVTKNLLFTFSTDVSQPGSEIVQGEYQINPRWSVSVARDQLGGVSVDGRFHTRF